MRGTLGATALLATACAGCASATSMQTADTLGATRFQVSAQQSYQTQLSRDSAEGYPMEGIALKYGVTDRVDVGGAVGPEGLEISTKVRLTRPGARMTVSVAPALAATGTLVDDLVLLVYQGDLPVLVGFRLPEDRELVLSARLHETIYGGGFDSSPASASAMAISYAGASGGVAFHGLGGKILPEVGFLYPVFTASHRYDGLGGLSWFSGKTLVQCTVSFLWGGR